MSPTDIKSLRIRLGLSRADFVARLGIKVKPDSTRQMCSRWERGKRNPSAAAMALIEQLREEIT